MKDWITLALAIKPQESDNEGLQTLNDLLGDLGVHFVVKEWDGATLLTIDYDPDVLNRKLKRNAGAKRKYISRSVPVAEIRSRMETETAEQIAKSLGISRPTLFRKLKYAEEWGYDYIM